MTTLTSSLRATSRRRFAITWWQGAAAVLAVVAVWQLASATGLLPASTLPSAIAVLIEWGHLLTGGAYWGAVLNTLTSALLGLLLAVAIGVIAGAIIGRVRFVRESTWFLVEFLRPIPPVAMIPLALLLWGPTETMKLVLIAYGALWPFLIQIIYGVTQVDGSLLRMAKSYRLSPMTTTMHVIFPAMLPFAATGVRVSASIALIVSVVTEIVGGAPGLGRDIVLAQSADQLPQVYALILTTGVLGVAMNSAFALIEKPLLFWHPSQRSKVS